MRKVMVMQREWQSTTSLSSGRYVNAGEVPGFFHGVFQQALEDGTQEPVVAIEYEDGRMDSVYLFQVRFLDKPDQ